MNIGPENEQEIKMGGGYFFGSLQRCSLLEFRSQNIHFLYISSGLRLATPHQFRRSNGPEMDKAITSARKAAEEGP